MKHPLSLLFLVKGAVAFDAHVVMGRRVLAGLPTQSARYSGLIGKPRLDVSPRRELSLPFTLQMTNNSEEDTYSSDDLKEDVDKGVEQLKDSMEDSAVTGKIQETVAKVKVTPEIVKGRKKRVIMGYKAMAAGFGVMASVIYALSRQSFYSTGPLLVSGVSYIMIGAAENSRLSSDTYKRLNLSLLEYGIVGIFAGFCMKLSPLWALTCLIAIINSIKGYGYGVKGWELGPGDIMKDIIDGSKSNQKVFTKLPNLKSAGYILATGTVGILKFKTILDVIKIIKSNGATYLLGTRLFRLAKLIMLTNVMFTLKDAADRDRLEGTTFIELNFLATIIFISWAAFERYTTPVGALMTSFSVMTAYNGLSSKRLKKKS
jgi:hypothetical protein